LTFTTTDALRQWVGPDPICPCLSVSCELDAHGLPFHALNL